MNVCLVLRLYRANLDTLEYILKQKCQVKMGLKISNPRRLLVNRESSEEVIRLTLNELHGCNLSK